MMHWLSHITQSSLTHQAAAGTLNYMMSFVIQSLRSTVPEDDMPPDLTETFLSGLEALMLAQAQEGVWQRAVMGKCTRVDHHDSPF